MGLFADIYYPEGYKYCFLPKFYWPNYDANYFIGEISMVIRLLAILPRCSTFARSSSFSLI